jgi:putative membrane protein
MNVRRIGFILIAVLAVIIGLLLGALNPMPVTLDLLWLQLELPLGQAVLAGFSIGLIAGILFMYLFYLVPARHRLRKTTSRLTRISTQPQERNPGATPDND